MRYVKLKKYMKEKKYVCGLFKNFEGNIRYLRVNLKFGNWLNLIILM